MLTTIKATFFHLIKLKQLLITPFALYSGLVIYFGLGEITRAYGSCMLGVEQVGNMQDFSMNLFSILFECCFCYAVSSRTLIRFRAVFVTRVCIKRILLIL